MHMRGLGTFQGKIKKLRVVKFNAMCCVNDLCHLKIFSQCDFAREYTSERFDRQ